MTAYAQHFYEIPEAIEENDEVRETILELVNSEPITGKALEGGDRTSVFRQILREFFKHERDLNETITDISTRLPRAESPHRPDNQTFADGWEERLARTQISRFYNQAVLQKLDEQGDEECFIPRSDHQKPDSNCTIRLAGGTANINTLRERLQRAYQDGEYHKEPMIPNHPHCTHTVTPASDD